jgi:hypothetical protein
MLGDSANAVQIAVRDMYREQEFGVIMLFTSISTTLLATGIQAFEVLQTYASFSVLLTYLAAVFILFYTGWNTFKIFHNSYHVSIFHRNKDKGNQSILNENTIK